MTTLLCVPILVHEPDAALAEAHAAKAAGADLVEFRVDEYFAGEPHQAAAVAGLVADSPLPCIVTCRVAAEGGHYEGDEEARIGLYEGLAMAVGEGAHPPRYLDIEHARLTPTVLKRLTLAMEHPEQQRDLTASLIVSAHDFAGRPADLTRRILKMRETAAAKVIKIAYRARSLRDNLELFDLLAERDRPTIALGMGEFGLMSRVLAPKFGGFLTFASLRPTTTTAPGQPTVAELLDLYRFRSIGPGTAVYGVIGHPLGHSLSPRAHNAGFAAAGRDAVYLPLPVVEGYESFKATLGELLAHPRLDLRGVSVTLPHKENLVRIARESGWDLDPVAAAVGAGNTLAVDQGGRVRVLNTDVPALVECLREAAGEISGTRAAVIGAGGVGRAAAYGLAAAGAHVTVFNRTREKADAVAESLRGLAAPVMAANLGDLPGSGFDLYVNCTPVGMAGGVSAGSSVMAAPDFGNTPRSAVVLDTVYNPADTPFLAAARAAGLRAVDGVSMFVRQAAVQFSVWTGAAPPAGLFDRVARAALAESAG